MIPFCHKQPSRAALLPRASARTQNDENAKEEHVIERRRRRKKKKKKVFFWSIGDILLLVEGQRNPSFAEWNGEEEADDVVTQQVKQQHLLHLDHSKEILLQKQSK